MVDAALVLEAADAHVVLAGVMFGLQVAQFAHVVSQVCTDGDGILLVAYVGPGEILALEDGILSSSKGCSWQKYSSSSN